MLHPRSLELEVDEWLYLTGFHLNDCDYHHYENQGVDDDGHAHEGALAALREAVGDEVQHISQHNEREHMPVAGEHVDEELGVEIGENLREHHSQVAPVASEEKALAGDVGIAEEQPGKNHEVEGDEHHECPPPAAVHPLGASCDAHPHLVDDECDAMQCSPHHKVERCAVPQSTQEHGNKEVEILAEPALAVTAQRDVEVVAQPCAQGDVPPVPEVGNRHRLVGVVEVDVKPESHEQCQAYRHVAVAREVAIDLQSISIGTQQVLQSAELHGRVEDPLHKVDADVVADDSFLEQACDHKPESQSQHLARNLDGTVHLRDEIAGAHDGSCHQLGEERHIEGIVEQVVDGLYLTPVHVDGVAQRLEGEERYAHGQEYLQVVPGRSAKVAPQLPKEIGVLEISQQSQVDYQAQRHHALAPCARAHVGHDVGNHIVAAGDNGYQEEIEAAALVVEIVAERHHKESACERLLLQHGVDDNEDRKHAHEQSAREDERRLLVVDQLLEQQPQVEIAELLAQETPVEVPKRYGKELYYAV